MRAAVLHSPGQPLVFEDRQDLQPVGAQRVVRVLAAGVCHSDLHMIDGAIGGPLPRVLGHEIAGHLAGAGEVLVYPCWSDGTCDSPPDACGKQASPARWGQIKGEFPTSRR